MRSKFGEAFHMFIAVVDFLWTPTKTDCVLSVGSLLGGRHEGGRRDAVMGTDTPVPDAPVPDEAVVRRWQQLRRWAASGSAAIAAVGIASALIGYLTAGAQFFSTIEEYFRGQSELHTLIDVANERLAQDDYEAAWHASTKARELAPRNAAAAQQQARIAMKWLEDVRVTSAWAGHNPFFTT